jgi:hypothetical protein
MKTYGVVEVQLHSFLTLALDGGEWSASRPCRFTYGERAPAGWVGPRASLDAVAKRQIHHPWRESNPGHAARNLYWLNFLISLVYIEAGPKESSKSIRCGILYFYFSRHAQWICESMCIVLCIVYNDLRNWLQQTSTALMTWDGCVFQFLFSYVSTKAWSYFRMKITDDKVKKTTATKFDEIWLSTGWFHFVFKHEGPCHCQIGTSQHSAKSN